MSSLRFADDAESKHFRSYLDNVDRIARSGYEPSDNDVLRARLRTLGVQEHELVFENSADCKSHSYVLSPPLSSQTRCSFTPWLCDRLVILYPSLPSPGLGLVSVTRDCSNGSQDTC